MVARARGPGQALGNAVLKAHCPGHEPITRAGRQCHRDSPLTFISLAILSSTRRRYRSKSKKGQRRLAMAEHKFKIGQLVYIHPKPLLAPRGPYKVIDRLQAPERGFQYLIRSEDGLHECIVRESELRGT